MCRDITKYQQIRLGEDRERLCRLSSWLSGNFLRAAFHASLIKPGLRVADFGTGTGAVARELARRGCKVVGVDIAAPMLKQALRLTVKAGLHTQYVQARAEATGLADQRQLDLPRIDSG